MKKQTVILTNQEILDALSKLEKAEKCKSISLPIKQLWELKKNIGKLEDVRKQFLSMSADIEKEYTDDEHSTETKRENGDVVRAVKKEYLQEFVQKKTELLEAGNDMDLSLFSLDDLDDGDFTLEVLDALAVFIEDTDE
jgi:hypothetical protein